MQKVIGKLEAAEYWEWRTTIAEMQVANEKSTNAMLQHRIIEKELEIKKLQLALSARKVNELKDSVQRAKTEYESYKKKLEDKLDGSLNGCVIDDVTFEIIQLEESNNNQKE